MYTLMLVWRSLFFHLHRQYKNRRPWLVPLRSFLGLISGFLLGATPLVLTACGGAELLEGTAHAQIGPVSKWPEPGTILSLPISSSLAGGNDALTRRLFGLQEDASISTLPTVSIASIQGQESLISVRFSDPKSSLHAMLGTMLRGASGLPEDNTRRLGRYDSQWDLLFRNAAWQLVKYRLWDFKKSPESFRSQRRDIIAYQGLIYSELVSLAQENRPLPLKAEMDIVCPVLHCEEVPKPIQGSPTVDPADDAPPTTSGGGLPPVWLSLPMDASLVLPLGGLSLPPKFPIPQDSSDIDACIQSRPFLKQDAGAAQQLRQVMLPLDAAARADFCKTLPEKPFSATILEYGNLYYQMHNTLYNELAKSLGVSESEEAQQRGYEAVMRHLMPSGATLKQLGTLGRGATATGLILLGSTVRLSMALRHPAATLASLVKPISNDEELAIRARWLAVKQDPNANFLQRSAAFLDDKGTYVAAANNYLLLGLPVVSLFNPFYVGALASTGLARVLFPLLSSAIKIILAVRQAALSENALQFEEAVHTGSAALYQIQMAVIVAMVFHAASALKIKPRIAGYLQRLRGSIATQGVKLIEAVAIEDGRFAMDAEAFRQRMLREARTTSPGKLPASQAEFAQRVLDGSYKAFIPELTPQQRAVLERVGRGQATLPEQLGMQGLMEKLGEVRPALEGLSEKLYNEEVAKSKAWMEKIRNAGSVEGALRVIGEAERALGDAGAFESTMDVLKGGVEKEAEGALKQIERVSPQVKALRRCGGGCRRVRAVGADERGLRARSEIQRKLKGIDRGRFEELAGKVERHARVSGLGPWMEMNQGLPGEVISGNLGQLERALTLAREHPGERVALTLGKEPVMWDGKGPPPIPAEFGKEALKATGTDGPITDVRGQVVERPGVSSGPQAVIEGGKPGKGVELGGMQGAGGPATAPERPTGPAEPGSAVVQKPAAASKSGEPVPEQVRPSPTPVVPEVALDLSQTIKAIETEAAQAPPLPDKGTLIGSAVEVEVARLPNHAEVLDLATRLNESELAGKLSKTSEITAVDPDGNLLTMKAIPDAAGKPGSRLWVKSEKPSVLSSTSGRFSESNFRSNLIKDTGVDPGDTAHAHHVFPKRYREKFTKAGVDIHYTKYGTWWEKTDHMKNAKPYNDAWADFFKKNNTPTKSEVLQYGRDLMKKYGIPVRF